MNAADSAVIYADTLVVLEAVSNRHDSIVNARDSRII
jgi:hypothetical protein